MRRVVGSFLGIALAGASACTHDRAPMTSPALHDFATRYTAAWCSQDPARVAAFFAPTGSLTINSGAPAVGRAAITASAASFMTAFPDLVVRLDSLRAGPHGTEYHWTLTGTNTGPGGTGRPVKIAGYEEWQFDAEDLIATSLGHFDAAEYQRQVSGA